MARRAKITRTKNKVLLSFVQITSAGRVIHVKYIDNVLLLEISQIRIPYKLEVKIHKQMYKYVILRITGISLPLFRLELAEEREGHRYCSRSMAEMGVLQGDQRHQLPRTRILSGPKGSSKPRPAQSTSGFLLGSGW